LNKHKKAIVALEKQRLTKERIFYLREDNDAKYQQALNKLQLVEGDVTDNLTKMTAQILHPDMGRLASIGFM
jgi:hypothetical protein